MSSSSLTERRVGEIGHSHGINPCVPRLAYAIVLHVAATHMGDMNGCRWGSLDRSSMSSHQCMQTERVRGTGTGLAGYDSDIVQVDAVNARQYLMLSSVSHRCCVQLDAGMPHYQLLRSSIATG